MYDRRPFVAEPVGDPDLATSVAVRIADRYGLGPVELVKVGMNAVFACDDGMLRVGRPTVPAAAAIALARRLDDVGLRVPLPRSELVAELDDLTVTHWERIEPSGDPIDWTQVGTMVARLHELERSDLPVEYPCPSPTTFPWWDFAAAFDAVSDLVDAAAGAGLSAAIERSSGWGMFDVATTAVCHGDLHGANVVQAVGGPVLLDWDLLCVAPRGWDHAPLMTAAERWGATPGEYEAFASGYGRSMRGDRDAEMFAELRLVAATLMRLRAGRSDPAAAHEAERRLRLWRGDPDAPPWRPQ